MKKIDSKSLLGHFDQRNVTDISEIPFQQLMLCLVLIGVVPFSYPSFSLYC